MNIRIYVCVCVCVRVRVHVHACVCVCACVNEFSKRYFQKSKRSKMNYCPLTQLSSFDDFIFPSPKECMKLTVRGHPKRNERTGDIYVKCQILKNDA